MRRIARTASLTAAMLIGSCEAVTEPEDRAVSFEVSGPGIDAITIGESAQYRAIARDAAGNVVLGYRFTWASSTPSVATIDSTGLAIGRSAGTTLISVTHRSGAGSLPLYVTQPVASVALVPPAAALVPGGQVTFGATPLDSAGSPVPYRTAVWSSTDSAVAAVASGRVTGGTLGTATIQATVDGKTGTALVTVALVRFTSVAAGHEHTCARSMEGRAYCWGSNQYYQLGDGSFENSFVPTAVWSDGTIESLSVGGHHACALPADGTAYCWGLNEVGQLGSGSPEASSVPVEVIGGLRFRSVSAGGAHSCGVATDGLVYCWGSNGFGELGAASDETCPRGKFLGPLACSRRPLAVTGGPAFESVSAGSTHTCGLTSGGEAYCWGDNSEGQLGDSSTQQRQGPTLVAGGLRFRQLSAGINYTCGVAVEGVVYCWGRNPIGQLGNGSTIDATYPVPIAGGLRFESVTAGGGLYEAHTCGVAVGGAAYCWGWNGSGQLGDGSRNNRSEPVPVAGGLLFRTVTVGTYHTCGLGQDDLVYCWGGNFSGQLGSGVEGALAPVRVSGQQPTGANIP